MSWQNSRRIYGTLIYLDMINQKIWIQEYLTEEGVANEIVNLGIPDQ
ncbi:element excision factor XisI family protein [Okeania sp. SIO3I5]|nr:element excision factor XisI family protein [Okeania sp. SIO3I5]